MSDETPNETPGEETPAFPAFAMLGEAEAPVCVDGVCEVPASARERDPAGDATASGPDAS